MHVVSTFLFLFLLFFKSSFSSVTYTFTFTETRQSNFFQQFFLNVAITVDFDSTGRALFRTNVLNVSPLHFSMYVNGQNCGIISRACNFVISPGESLAIEVYKIDMQSKLVTFVYNGDNVLPTVYILNCQQNLTAGGCTHGYQDNSDTNGIKYHDDICFCQSILNLCVLSSQDGCVSTSQWWNNGGLPFSSTSPRSTIPTTSKSSSLSTTTVPTTTIRTTKPTTKSTSPPPTTKPTTLPTSTKPTTTATKPTTQMTTVKHSTVQTTKPTTTNIPTTTPAITTTSTTSPTTEPYKSTVTNSTITSTSLPLSGTTTISGIDTFPSLKNLSDSGVGINNVSRVLNETLHYSNIGPDLNSTQVREITTILYNSASLPGLKAENSYAILQNLDNVMDVDSETMYASGGSTTQILQMLPNMVDNTDDERVEYLEGKNLGFSSRKIDCTKLENDDGLLDLGHMFALINSTTDTNTINKKNSIMVPLIDLCSTQELSHVFFTIYRDKSVFAGKRAYRTYDGRNTPLAQSSVSISQRFAKLDQDDNVTLAQSPSPSPCARQTSVPTTPVMSATILNKGVMISRTATNSIMAVLRFNTTEINRPLHGELKVTWWDEGRLQWATDRQCKIISNSNGFVEAQCIHLTDFAIIVDAALNDPNVCDTALIDLGYVVNGLSIFSLFILTSCSISAYIKRLSQSRFYQYFRGHNLVRRDFLALVYHFDLLLFYVLFTIFSNQDVSGSFCTIIAAVTYALLLCSLFLTVFQGIRNVLTFLPPKFYRFFDIFLSTPTILATSIAVPFTLSIFLLVFTSFFDRQDCFCWVRPDFVIYAIIIPVSILLISSVFCTSFIVYKVFCGMKRKFSQAGHHHHDPNIITKIMSIIIMQISLGMPWILQFGTLYSPYTTFWHYMFTIIMGSQGTVLLLIFFYKRYRARQSESMATSSSKSRDEFNSKTFGLRPTIRNRAITHEESLTDTNSSDTFHEY